MFLHLLLLANPPRTGQEQLLLRPPPPLGTGRGIAVSLPPTPISRRDTAYRVPILYLDLPAKGHGKNRQRTLNKC